MKEFFGFDEAVAYAESHWKPFFEGLPSALINNVLSIKSGGRRLSNPSDKEVIEAIKEVITIIPPFDEDVVLYRGGKESDFDGDRPYLSSSFIKTTGESFCKNQDSNLYKIRVYKGSRAIPTCGMGIPGCEAEQGVILETRFIHRNGTECDYYEDLGYYKLYHLKDKELYSSMALNKPICINEVYSSTHTTSQLCFAKLDYILDYMDIHGTVVCDVIPLDIVTDSTPNSKQYSECKTIIPHNPRSIYSPSFISKLLDHPNNTNLLKQIINEDFIKGSIEHFHDGKCYRYSLDFDLSETLTLLLLKKNIHNNEIGEAWINEMREEINYSEIYKIAKQNQADLNALNVIVHAWNIYSPCFTSKLLLLGCSIRNEIENARRK